MFFKLFFIISFMVNYQLDDLDPYFKEACTSYPPLTKEEEIECARRYRQGDIEARDKLLLSNQRFVISVAKGYREYGLSIGLSFGELISEGNYGLLAAIERFDETRGFKFITYAVWWIRQSILKALTEQPSIRRKPSSRINDLRKIMKATSKLQQSLGREPTLEEIAEGCSFSRSRVENAVEVQDEDISMDKDYGEDRPSLFYSIVGDKQASDPYNTIENREMVEIAEQVLREADDRERVILLNYFRFYGKELTLEQIGELIGVTRERVRQIRDNFFDRIRITNTGRLVSDFLKN